MEKQRNIPALRFPEFTSEWECKKLGEDCNILMCKRIFSDETSENEEIPFYKIGTLGSSPDVFIKRTLFEEYKNKYNFPKRGEILITCSGTVGKCIPFDGKDAYYQDSNIVWIDNPKLNIKNEFLFYVISNIDWGKLNSTTITRIYGDDFRNLGLRYPFDSNEQTKIATFLTSVDERLNQLKKKKSLLEQYKRGVMQKIFDQEIRFKDEEGNEFPEWSKTRLGNIAIFINGRAYKQEELLASGKYPVLRVGNFFSNSNWYYSDLELDSEKYCQDGDLLYAWSASFGPKIWSGGKTIFHYHIWKVLCKNQVDLKYLFFILHEQTTKIKANSSNGIALLHITKSTIEDWEIHLPTLAEQTKIANFLTAIDDKISLCDKQITRTEQYRKGLLQQMFV